MKTMSKPSNSLTAMANRNTAMSTDTAMETMVSNYLKAQNVPTEMMAKIQGQIVQLIKSSEALQQCDVGTIGACVLKGIGEKLILGLHYYVVPYGKTATFIRSAKGYATLAVSTGMYEDIDVRDVREGEYKGRDSFTGKVVVDFGTYPTEAERLSKPVIGYWAYYVLKDGTRRGEFWSMDQLFAHAERYAYFDKKKYADYQSGKVAISDRISPWYTSTEKMCAKTVLKSLLTSGYAPLNDEVRWALDTDSEAGYVIPDAVPGEFAKDADSQNPISGTLEARTATETVEPKELPTNDKKSVKTASVNKRPSGTENEVYGQSSMFDQQ